MAPRIMTPNRLKRRGPIGVRNTDRAEALLLAGMTGQERVSVRWRHTA
jgi:hypothetical protein